MARRDFIDALVDDLTPVEPATAAIRVLIVWSICSWFVVGQVILLSGGLREGAITSLVTTPRYAFEFALAMLASLTAIHAGFEWGVPGHPNRIRTLLAPIVLFGAWIGILVYGLFDPALHTGHLGARPLCDAQTFAYALPPLLLALYWMQRRSLFARAGSGLMVGLGAAAVSAAWMQLACLYDPIHTLVHHLVPVAIVGGLGGACAHWLLPRN